MSLGIVVKPVTSNEANKYGLSSQTGVAIEQVAPDSPFGKAGFQKDDIILQVDDQSVSNAAGLYTMLTSLKSKHRVAIQAVDHTTGQVINVFLNLP